MSLVFKLKTLTEYPYTRPLLLTFGNFPSGVRQYESNRFRHNLRKDHRSFRVDNFKSGLVKRLKKMEKISDKKEPLSDSQTVPNTPSLETDSQQDSESSQSKKHRMRISAWETFQAGEPSETEQKKEHGHHVQPYECLLFPTYATRESGENIDKNWLVRVHGWVGKAEAENEKGSWFLGGFVRLIKSSSSPSSPKIDNKKDQSQHASPLPTTSKKATTHLDIEQPKDVFQQRMKYFLVSNASDVPVTVQAIGVDQAPDHVELVGETILDDDNIWQDAVSTFVSGGASTTSTPNSGRSAHVKSPIPENKAAPESTPQDHGPLQHTEVQGPMAQITTKPTGQFNGLVHITASDVETWNTMEIDTKEEPLDEDEKIKRKRLIRLQAFTRNENKITSTIGVGVANLMESTGISLISDIDDTIKHTHILRGKLHVVKTTFFDRPEAVDGMSDLYHSLYTKANTGFHYVSNSPWQLFPTLRQFFHENRFPPGSVHLKLFDWRDKNTRLALLQSPLTGKYATIKNILADFPNRKFILIGDSGEMDPELYSKIYRENASQIALILIRDVTTKYILGNIPAARSNLSVERLEIGKQTPTETPIQEKSSSEPGLNEKEPTTTDVKTIELAQEKPSKSSITKLRHLLTGSKPSAATNSSTPPSTSVTKSKKDSTQFKLEKFSHRISETFAGIDKKYWHLFEDPKQLIDIPYLKILLEEKTETTK